jgi:hypothetical protein
MSQFVTATIDSHAAYVWEAGDESTAISSLPSDVTAAGGGISMKTPPIIMVFSGVCLAARVNLDAWFVMWALEVIKKIKTHLQRQKQI